MTPVHSARHHSTWPLSDVAVPHAPTTNITTDDQATIDRLVTPVTVVRRSRTSIGFPNPDHPIALSSALPAERTRSARLRALLNEDRGRYSALAVSWPGDRTWDVVLVERRSPLAALPGSGLGGLRCGQCSRWQRAHRSGREDCLRRTQSRFRCHGTRWRIGRSLRRSCRDQCPRFAPAGRLPGSQPEIRSLGRQRRSSQSKRSQ